MLSMISGFSVTTAAVAAGLSNDQGSILNSDGFVVPHEQASYALNQNGQTYGTAKDAVYIEDYPELMAAVGDHGIEGYVYLCDFLGEDPASPEEAMIQQEKREEAIRNGTYQPSVLKVYASDGKTVLDTLTKGGI